MRFRAVPVFFLSLAVVAIFAAVLAAAPKHAASRALIYTSTPHYDALAWLHAGERFPEGAKLMIRQGAHVRALVPDFYATADANVSFDGTKVLFAGKKTESDHWQIWQMKISGGQPTQLTSCSDDCVRPFYLPEDRIVYAEKMGGSFQLEASPAGQGQPQRLTFMPGNALPTDVLHDGRVLFEANFPLGDGTTAETYTVYPDGSGVEAYRCDHGDNRYEGKQMSSGDIVFADDHGLGRFTSSLAHEVQIKAPAGDSAGDVAELSRVVWIASWRSNANEQFSVREWNRRTNSVRTLAAENGADLVEPVLAGERPIPNRFPSALLAWKGADLLCLNAYTSKLKIPAGSVEAVNVYALQDGKPELLGRAPVAKDGSFFVHVPGDQPLQFELLDASGKTVQRERGWFWLRNGEQRECVGCHAGPERAPENAVPKILVKSPDPTDFTHKLTAQKGGH